MKRIIVVILLLCIPNICKAWDGELSIGKYFGSTKRAYPDGGIAQYIGTMEIGHKIKFARAYIRLESLFDAYINGLTNFHPSSIKYDIGLKISLPHNFYMEYNNFCWHPIDKIGRVEHYDMFKIGIKFNKD